MIDQLVTDAEIEERIESERLWAGRPDYRRTLDMRALLDLKAARARIAALELTIQAFGTRRPEDIVRGCAVCGQPWPLPWHVVDVRTDGWALEHPVACRRAGSLHDCPVHRWCVETFDAPPASPGRYPVIEFEGGYQLAMGRESEA